MPIPSPFSLIWDQSNLPIDKMKKNLIAPILGAGLIVGFSLGWMSSSTVQSNHVASEIAKKTERNKTTRSTTNFVIGEASPDDLKQLIFTELTKNRFKQNEKLVEYTFSEWSLKDPQGALAFAQEQKRSDWIEQCLESYGRYDPDAAITWIEQNTRDLHRKRALVAAVYQGLAKENPAAAISRAEQLPIGTQRDEMFHSIVEIWADYDAHAAFGWIETQEPSSTLTDIYHSVMGNYISQSPEKALFLIDAMENTREKEGFVNQAAFEIAGKDLNKALDWANALDGKQRHAALVGVIEQWVKKADTLEALNYIYDLPEDKHNELFSIASTKLAQTDPDTLVREFPKMDESQQRVAASQLAQVYANNDPDQVEAWLETLESPHVRDAAVRTSLRTFLKSDIRKAFDLSTSISERLERRDEITRTLVQWAPIDNRAAMDALHASGLPDNEVEIIAKRVAAQAPAAKDYLLPAQ